MRYKKRIVWGSIAAVALLVFIAFRFYDAVRADLRLEKEQAVKTVLQETRIEQVDAVRPFVGDKPYMVVYGKSDRDEEMIAWVHEDGVDVKLAREGVSSETIREKMLAKNPEMDIVHINAGKMQDVFVWEVFYKQKEEAGERYYYDYYRFSDGSHLDTYRMAAR
ncbi:DUF5590 domain-containing protein [Paenibacillus sp. 32O-W]|uniref:cell wall elongation regulator TseB-like domain-containing protein n=1 Tax=Paenibacillus sp. 32O-W TaxID=1695218 RepID=UPI0011A34D28|nr:DUF5590 domain-containing protein [Paenibacillus sp. 32O-W]